MQITNNYILFILFMCISSLALGIITIMNIDKKFDGLIIDSDGGPLDFEKYINTNYGKSWLTDYINNNIKNNNYLQKNTQYNMINVSNAFRYLKGNKVPIIFQTTKI